VFEEGRTLVITEKSSKEAFKLEAAPSFNMVATMNPSGDFGKKELSPALRNRMTEIWVESYFNQDSLVQMMKHLPSNSLPMKPSAATDLSLIISKLCEDSLSQITAHTQVATGIFCMITHVMYSMAEKFFALQRKAMSIRDILSVISFVKINHLDHGIIGVADAFRHAVELVVIDGICLGIDVAGADEQNAILRDCTKYLEKIMT